LFPSYFQLYLDSVAINTDTLRIILITDNIHIYDTYILPSNVIVVIKTIDDIRLKAIDTLLNDFAQSLPDDILITPYKLCDFRPLYPVIFNDIIAQNNVSSHDFIGWSDCDLIYGKISSMMNISNYDGIGFYGHFTALRNIPILINAYKKLPSESLFKITLSPLSHQIDERDFVGIITKIGSKNNIKYYWTQRFIADIIPWMHRKESKYDRNKEVHMLAWRGKKYKYNTSHLVFNSSSQKLQVFDNKLGYWDILYVHLQKREMTVNFLNYSNSFNITKTSFEKIA
jgi:hypothetical protein